MAIDVDTARAGPPSARTLGYLPGLDGLRALAVMAVLLYHADLRWIPGGFLGVDVFFVISGYLITSLLLAESRRTGQIDLRRFWMRRARRLLPALFVMLATVALFTLVFLPDEVAKLRGDLVGAVTYVENWWLIFRNQSYFEAIGRPPMLQHLWSLAVEEQFYLFWPVLFFGGMVLFRRRRSRLLLAIFAGIALSTLLMAILYHPGDDPSRVYYGTDTRIAALLVGAALAFVWSPWRLQARVGPGARAVLDVVGIGALVALAWIVLNTSEFEPGLYRGGFLIVALLSAIVIGVTVHPVGGILTAFLSLPVLRWIGVRSYAIYLWHWPVYMITRPHLDIFLTGYPLLVLRIGITFGLAALSYRWVERPVRSGAIRQYFGRLRTSEGPERARLTRVTLLSGGAATLAVVLIVAGLTRANPAPVPPGFSKTASAAATSTTTTTLATVGTPTPTPPPAPLPVVGIGDSVMLGAQDALTTRMPGMVVDAAVSRHFGEVVDIARSYRDSGRLGNAVVIHMGTNGLITEDEFDAMMESFRGVKRVIIVNLKVARRWEGEDNDVLTAAVRRWPNTVLVDWNTAGNAHPEFFYPDGIHLRAEGAAFYADLIARAIG